MEFCGDTNQAHRINIQSKEFSHPPVKKGEQLTVWLDNANTDISWGVVLHNQEHTSKEIIKQIEEEADRRQKEGLDPEGVPEPLKGKMIETGPGRAADLSDDCCACWVKFRYPTFVRQQALGSPLVSFETRVKKAMQRIYQMQIDDAQP